LYKIIVFVKYKGQGIKLNFNYLIFFAGGDPG